MILIDKCRQLDRLAKLIETRQTGNATQLAKKINVSRSKLYEIFEDFKMLGVDISFSKEINSYYYTSHFRLKVNTPIQVISSDEKELVNGGCSINLATNNTPNNFCKSLMYNAAI
ncbi:hypothetical protein E9993_18300 [Labilibacter sediminis]|nr:hypothetical protein E9993_18300 [Labilibacter sediminis]